jgi:preprotein translocase subunit SecF
VPSVKSVAQVPLSEEHRSIKASQATRRSAAQEVEVKEVKEVLTELENDVPSIRPVKGSNKLQKRMHTLDQAIDMERIAQERLREAQENISASYTDVVAPTQEEDVEVEFEHV